MTITKKQIDVICNANIGWSEEAQKALEERERLELNYTSSLYETWDRISQDCPKGTRYEKDCIRLFYLAKRQLNLEKNAKKGDFETLSPMQIVSLLKKEIIEVEGELLYFASDSIEEHEAKDINYQRAREEIGDVAAYLVGLLAKLNKMEKEEK